MVQATHSDVLIVGGGIAGMTAALRTLEQSAAEGKPVSITLLDADTALGGRAKSITHEGVTLSSGASWFHGGEDDPFFNWLTERYGAPKAMLDAVENHYSFKDRQPFDRSRDETIQSLDKAYRRFKEVYPGEDISLQDLSYLTEGVCEEEALKAIASNWMAVDSADQVSADEFFGDTGSAAGGWQPEGGMGAIAARMRRELEEAGVRIVTGCRVTSVRETADGIIATSAQGDIYAAKHGVIALPVGVLQGGNITFTPAMPKDVAEYVDSLSIARFAKVIVPMDESFFKERGFLPNTKVSVSGFYPQSFCQAYSAGQPAIVIMAGGVNATAIESMNATALEKFVGDFFDQIPIFKGYEAYRTGAAHKTDWNTNPLYMSSYSAMKIGRQRQETMTAGKLTFCGEAFAAAADSASTMTGAWRSGLNAGTQIMQVLFPAAKTAPGSIPDNKIKP